MAEEPAWLAAARAKLGTLEAAGPANSPTIMGWAKRLGIKALGITLIYGVEVVRRRNVFQDPMRILFDVSVGGLGPDPKAPKTGWVSELALDYVKVLR